MNIKRELETKVGIANSIYLNNIDIPPLTIKAIMINEVVPSDPLQDFYGLPEIYYKGIRIMPSYIMTGGNILIEKSKVAMATEDIATMLEIIK